MSLLEINNLHCYFTTKQGTIKAVNGVSLKVEEGRTLGVIGESGSGKSQTAMSVLKLFEKNQKIHDGEIIFDGVVLSRYDEKQMMSVRGNSISMIFQDPMTSLNPVFTIERQIVEVLMLHRKMKKHEAKKEAERLLESVKIPNPESLLKRYPHELSGGMRQRVMIATALACKPKLLIADEPTTALDVTIQAQILLLMNELKEKNSTAIMFITHDLGVIKLMADDVAVMYCGQVVEIVEADTIFDENSNYSHPYTQALLSSIPSRSFENDNNKNGRLNAIEGNVPHPLNLPKGCKFAPRCQFATQQCIDEEPKFETVINGHSVRCFYPDKRRRGGQ